MSNLSQQKKSLLEKLPRPFLMLAPMADVTDVVFRHMIATYGKPDLMWTEFVSADGLFLRPQSGVLPETEVQKIAYAHGIDPAHPLLIDLLFNKEEHPIMAQFFSKDPDLMRRAASLAHDLGFDGIDINMGCPAAIICKQGAGSAMIQTPQLAQEIIRATKEGAGGLPVTVKTRIGYNKNELETWLPALLEAEPDLIIFHARTKKEMSKVDADWSQVKRAVEIRNALGSHVLIAGNGDVSSREEAYARAQETGADGIMVGRALFGNPWFFSPDKQADLIPLEEKFRVMLEHTKLFLDTLGSTKNFALMKKHYRAYVNGFDGAKELRVHLMEAETYEEIESLAQSFLNKKNPE